MCRLIIFLFSPATKGGTLVGDTDVRTPITSSGDNSNPEKDNGNESEVRIDHCLSTTTGCAAAAKLAQKSHSLLFTRGHLCLTPCA